MGNQEASEVLRTLASQVLKKSEDEIDLDKSFTEQGGDMLTTIFFTAQCRDAGILVEMDEVSSGKTLRELAPTVIGGGPKLDSDNASEEQHTTISPTQLQSLYHTASLFQSTIWRVDRPLTHPEAVEMVEMLMARHPVLRASVELQGENHGLKLGNATTASGTLKPFESQEECEKQVEELRTQVSESTTAHALSMIYFGDASQIKMIGLVASTGAIDAQSWQILFRDMQDYQSKVGQGREQAVVQVHKFSEWVEMSEQRNEQHEGSTGVDATTEQVYTAASTNGSSHPLPLDSDVKSSTASLSVDLTDTLHSAQCHQVLRTEVSDLLLASVFSSLRGLSSEATEYLEIRDGRPQGHSHDWDSVIGCFDELANIPLQLHGSEDISSLHAARLAKDARRRSGLASVSRMPKYQNLILDTTNLKRESTHPSHPHVSRHDVARRIVQSLGGIYVLPFWTEDRLVLTLICSAGFDAGAELATLSKGLAQRIDGLVTTLTRTETTHATLSDFPHLSLDYPSLDHLYEKQLQNVAKDPLAEIEGVYPCSPIQNSFLIGGSRDKEAYTLSFTIEISASGRYSGSDTGTWARAWSKIVEKHAALRTVFAENKENPGQFYQVVLRNITPRIDMVDDITKCPTHIEFHPLEVPHHFTFAQTGPGQFTLVMTISHAITDGHSTDVIFGDMLTFVSGHSGKDDKALPYSEYVLQSHSQSKESAYWRSYLQRTQETQLPVTREQETLRDFTSVQSVIPLNVTSMDRLCQRHQINLASLCQFAWGVVLRSHMGSDDVCFSSISSVRHVPLEGIMTAVGPLITTLLCSLNLPGDKTVLDAIKAVNDDYQESLAHEAELSDSISPRRWSNTVMSFRRRLVQDDDSLPGLSTKFVKGSSPTNYDASLIVSARRADLEITLDYWASRIDRDYARDLLQSYQAVLQSIFRDIRGTVAGLDLVSDDQRSQILARNARVPTSLNRCVHDLVDDRIKSQPQALAIDAWDGSMTYGELEENINYLSRRLSEIGVGPDVPVGLCMAKSKLVPVIILAILRAGGAVVPIGVSEPIPRAEAIVADSSPIALICDRQQLERLSGANVVGLLDVAELIPDSSTSSATRQNTPPRDRLQEPKPNPGRTAWIFYTSGSTGTPKGVILEHDALATSMHAHGKALGMSEKSRILQFAAHTFDVSLYELLTTLIYGGCVCIPEEQARVNDLVGSVRRLQVNTLSLTSSVASTIMPADVPLVEKLVLFGEEVKASVVEAWLGKAAILNAYGPTESSIFASVSKPFRTIEDRSNIGYGMNVNLWVVDPEDPERLCTPGAPGEMLIEGPLLARGYLNDQSKTAAAFLSGSKFASDLPGSGRGRRFYRTGDIVRQNPDLSMSYVGRRDTQIKIRGQRLDISEVEYWVFKLLPGALRAVVGLLSVREVNSKGSQSSLFAAVEFSDDTEIARQGEGNGHVWAASEDIQLAFQSLRGSLQAKLPSYMIPTFFIPFVQIPLTASGKTDRKLVRNVVGQLSTADLDSYVSKGADDAVGGVLSETAQNLQLLWATTLGIDSASIRARDNFLYLGGDSVSAIKLVEAARRKNIHITVVDVLSYPMLEDLARLVDDRTVLKPDEGAEPSDPPPFSLWKASAADREVELADIANQCGIRSEDIEDVYPCTPLQQSMMAATQKRPTAYLARRVYSLAHPIQIDRFQQAWIALMERAPLMRTRILLGQRSGSLQVLTKAAPAWVHHNDLREYVAEDESRAMAEGEPLMRFALIEEAPDTHYFVWTAHHSAYDGWSAELIYRQFAAQYWQVEPAPVVPFTRFIDYLQSDHLRGEEAASFWQSQLEGDVPSAFPALPNSFYQPRPTSIHHSDIDSTLFNPESKFSLADILRAAWAVTLSQYLGTRQVVFGATLSGRNAATKGITELIAPTITTVPVRVSFNSNQKESAATYLDRIQSQAVQMIPFEHTGLDDIKALVPDLHSAVDVNHVLVIQPPRSGESGGDAQFPGMRLVDTAIDAFDTFALTVQCQLPASHKDPVEAEIRYDSHVVDESQVEVLLRQFQYWVSQFCNETNRDRPLDSLDGVSSSDLAQIKKQNFEVPVRDNALLHHLVWSETEEHPDAAAVCAWDGAFTYEELRHQARKLALHLRSHGVDPDVKVAVCMDKSKWTIVSFLGILEAGGVIVSLGTQHPMETRITTLEDCQAQIILTNAVHTESMAATGPLIIDISDAFMASLPSPDEGMQICQTLTLDHPAWIVYTSGSTGRPKGILLIHACLATSLSALGRGTRWSRESRVLQFAAHTFDVTLQEVMTTLIFGGCVCVPSESQRVNSLAQAITDMNVNSIVLTFTVASTLDPADVPSVKQLQVVGEQAKPAVIERWLPHVELVNTYGPSECSVYSSCSQPMQKVEDGPVVGFPLDRCNFWIANPADHNRLSPIGVPGELLVENAWPAREYLNNPELTARSFVVDPGFMHQLGLANQGRRMYRTGDLIRQNPNGSYTYIGRIDSQVKFRGHRVNLAEVEYWVVKLLGECTAAVVDMVDLKASNGANDLVAVVEFDAESELLTSHETEEVNGVKVLAPSTTLQQRMRDLKDALLEKLPNYMVPTAFFPWQKIPLNPSGKTNRAAVRKFLESLENGSSFAKRYVAVTGTKEAPRTEMGERLRQLWAQVLSTEVNYIGAGDHFTRLGGDSLAAMKLVTAGREVGIYLTVALIFTHPILEDCARALEEDQRAGNVTAPAHDPLPFELVPNSKSTTSPDLESRIADVAAQCQVAPQQIEDIYPCTPTQEALFAVTAKRPETYIYRQVFRASPDVNMASFQSAWETVAKELPLMRTRIVLDRDAGFLQTVIDSPMIWGKGDNLNAYLDRDAAQGFQPGQPLLRCAFIAERSPNGGFFFVMTTHHSMFDKWSLQKMYRNYIYPAYVGLEMAPVVPFPRFIQHVINQDEDSASRYWNNFLSEGDPFTDFPPLPSQSSHHPEVTSTLSQAIQANNLSRLQVPFPSVLRAAWALTVSQFSAAEDVMFAVNLSGRSAAVADVTEMIAPTLTTVPVRVQIDGAQKVQDFLLQVHRDSVEMMPHEHIGLQKIKQFVPSFAPGDLRHLFLVYPAVDADVSNPSLLVPGFEQVDSKMSVSGDYPLTVICAVNEDGNGATIDVKYASEVIQKEYIQSVLRQFVHNIEQLSHATTETQTLASLEMSNSQDHDQIRQWNSNDDTSVSTWGCIHDPIRRRVEQCPEAQSICSWDGELTYRQLDQLVSNLAYILQTEAGVGPESRVGLLMDKSRWAVVAILAVLYAGGAVVPVGVQTPLERLQVIFDDCSPAVVLCDEAYVDKLTSLGREYVVVDEPIFGRANQKQQGDQLLKQQVSPENLAWILYTSGSSGTPKGVMLEHGNLNHSLVRSADAWKIDSTSRAFQFAAFFFDGAIGDIFMTLARGGTVCVPSESDRMNDLVGVIKRYRATHLRISPSTAALVDPAEVPDVQMITMGGENLMPAVVDKWLRNSVKVVNSYGPAECSINATHGPVYDKESSAIIGRPHLGTKVWVVDPKDHNRLAPVGAAGELLIQGPNVGRGYLNDPEKTAKAFITNPGFLSHVGGTDDGRPMYLTGDLVRYNAKNGALTLFGRSDSQVKIRGQRVDMGEIESWISRLVPDLRLVVVEYLAINNEQRALIAALEFLAPEKREITEVSEILKKSLAKKLPAYMVPNFYVQLQKTPKTASGKVDRRAVRKYMLNEGLGFMANLEPDMSKPGVVEGDRETLVRKLWAAVLGVQEDRIDRKDNFFDLGADSIGAMKLIASAKVEGLDIRVVDVFENPVLYELAAATSAAPHAHVDQASSQYRPFTLLSDVQDIDAFLEETICPMTGTQKESILDIFPPTDAATANLAGALTSSQVEVNTFVLDSNSRLDLGRLQQCLILLAGHIEAFRTVFVHDVHNRRMLQVVLEDFQHDVPVIKTEKSIEISTKEFMESEGRKPFQLGRPMLNMIILHQENSSRTRILFRMSHAIYDGLSLPIIWTTLRGLYDAGDSFEAPRLSSFAHYVQDVASSVSDEGYKYWQTLLSGSVMPDLGATSSSTSQIPLTLEFTEKKTLPVSKPKGEGITTSTIIHAAWACVLAQLTGQDDVVFGDTISGRSLVDPSIAESSVGCCATHVPMRIKLRDSGHATSLKLLRQVRDQQRQRLPHEGIGFRDIIRNCTNWLPSTRFTSIVNHRPGAVPTEVPADGGVDFNVSLFTSDEMPLTSWYDLAVISRENDGLVEVSLGYASRSFESEKAQQLLEDLVAIIQRMMSGDALDWELSSLMPTVLTSPAEQGSVNGTAVNASATNSTAINGTAINGTAINGKAMNGKAMNGTAMNGKATNGKDAIDTALEKLWAAVFKSKPQSRESLTDKMASHQLHHTPFYRLGGDLLDVFHLVALFEQRSIRSKHTAEVTVDHVLRHPSLAEFSGFLHHGDHS